ncbi:MAG: ABC transporter ATP-binding protein [Deltaproteobacteria bacterium]|nr:ABC transporter ATP-binding protein [Deltaproteobacteria bacterium]
MSAVVVRNVSKRFAVRRDPHGGVRKRGFFSSPPVEDFWALRDIDFTVPPGGALGIVGANGSGKSTLLQIVAGVLAPTTGRVEATGRVISILNPTAGFHPDLSGRANVRMLGSLFGLDSKTIEGRMDAIISFSGLDDYIDQALRTYSAGMMIRLGFATASHLSPDVLVVDEVLSAGDLAFQRRSVGMARQLREQGCTVLVSTHALGDLATLCDRLMLLEQGAVQAEGSADEVVAAYMQRIDAAGGKIAAGHPMIGSARPTSPTKDVELTSIVVNGQASPDHITVHTGEPLHVELHYEARQPVDDAVFRVQLFRNDGLFVHGQNTVRAGLDLGVLQGSGVVRLDYPAFGLLGGDYYLSVGVWPDEYRSYTTGEAYDHRPSVGIVHMVDQRSDGAGVAGFPARWAHDTGANA